MKKVLVIVAVTALAASAWAGTLPNAADEHVMRFGPLASAVFEVNMYYGDPYDPWRPPREESETRWGGGVGVWGQYDRTWIGYAMRLGAAVLDGGRTSTFLDWEHEYYFYLLKGRFRPFIVPLLGIRYLVKVEHYFPEGEGGAFSVPLGLYFGARWNAAGSPFYTTISAGYKYRVGSAYLRGGWVMVRGQGYFGLTDTVALLAGIEFGRGSADDYYGGGSGVWRARFDVGPSWAF